MVEEKVIAVPWGQQAMNFIKNIHENEEAANIRCQKVKDLFQEDPAMWHSPKCAYIDEIMREYWSARILFSIRFHYLTLDCCRKIIELLVRFQQDINPDSELKNIRERIRLEMPWKKEEIGEAENVYNIGCSSVHSQRPKIWEHSRHHSRVDEPSMSRVLENKMPDNLKRFIPSLKKTIHGTFGMEDFTLEILNKTVDLANSVVKANIHQKVQTNIPKE